MAKLRLISAVLLAVPLIVFGANYFLQLFPLPEGDGGSGDKLLQDMRDGGLMGPVAASHVVIGALLCIPKFRFFAALLQLPMSIGIVAFHAVMLPEGLPLAIVMLVLNLGAMAESSKWKALL